MRVFSGSISPLLKEQVAFLKGGSERMTNLHGLFLVKTCGLKHYLLVSTAKQQKQVNVVRHLKEAMRLKLGVVGCNSNNVLLKGRWTWSDCEAGER